MRLSYLWMIALLGPMLSCDKGQLIQTRHGVVMRFDSIRLKKLKEVSWSVGQGLVKQNVSKGFTATIGLPGIGGTALKELYEVHKVDSWMVKVERHTPRWGKELIGHFMVPLRVQTQKGLRISSGRRVQFRVYYAAASISPRFERLPCPAFEHSLQLDQIRVVESESVRELFTIRRRSVVRGGVKSAGFVSLEFNGGASLKGNYTISVSLYNSVSRVLMSEYVPVRDSISIGHERAVAIKGCGGFEISEPKRERRSLWKTKFRY